MMIRRQRWPFFSRLSLLDLLYVLKIQLLFMSAAALWGCQGWLPPPINRRVIRRHRRIIILRVGHRRRHNSIVASPPAAAAAGAAAWTTTGCYCYKDDGRRVRTRSRITTRTVIISPGRSSMRRDTCVVDMCLGVAAAAAASAECADHSSGVVHSATAAAVNNRYNGPSSSSPSAVNYKDSGGGGQEENNINSSMLEDGGGGCARRTSTTTTTTATTTTTTTTTPSLLFRYHHLRNVTRILCLSDLHTDHPQNFDWVDAHTATTTTTASTVPEDGKDHHHHHHRLSPHDVLIVAGDISHQSSTTFRSTLRLFTQRVGCHVVFVPGNHEAWLSSAELASSSSDQPTSSQNHDTATAPRTVDQKTNHDAVRVAAETTVSSSFEKLELIYQICREEGALVDPVYIEGSPTSVWILPLQSWYDGSLSFAEPLCTGFSTWPWVDFDRCVWPGYTPAETHSPNARIPQGLVQYFLDQNQKNVFDPWRQWQQQQEQQQEQQRGSDNNDGDDAAVGASTSTAGMSSTITTNTLVITVSHFAPNQQCLPDWKDLTATTFQTDDWLDHGAGTMSAKFAKVAGTSLLDEQLRRNIIVAKPHDAVHADAAVPTTTSALVSSSSSSAPPPHSISRYYYQRHIHVFGHSHRPKDFDYKAIRYIHNPLGKPRERELYMIDPDVTYQCVWENGRGEVRGDTVVRYWEQYGGGTDMLQQRWDRVVRSTSTRTGRYSSHPTRNDIP